MHRHEKLRFHEPEELCELPSLKSDRVECPRCHYLIPVPVEFIDWEEVANRYRECYHRLVDDIFNVAGEAGEAFGAPVREYFEAEVRLRMQTIKDILEGLQGGGDL